MSETNLTKIYFIQLFVLLKKLRYNIFMTKNKSGLRHNLYTESDSGLAFLLAIFAPYFLIVIVTAICTAITGLPYSVADQSVKSFANTYPFVATIISSIVPQVSFLATFFIVSERRKVNYKLANQFNFKLDYRIILSVILIGIVAMFGFSPLSNMLDYFSNQLGYKTSVSIDISSTAKFFVTVLFVGILPAVCEELIFRGIITNGLKKYGTKLAIILSAILFALIHQNLQQLLYQLFLGGVMAYIAIKTGSIFYTMILHFFNNFSILFFAFVFGQSEQTPNYSNAWNIILPIIMAIASVFVVLGILKLISYLLNKKQTAELEKDSSLIVETETNNSDIKARNLDEITDTIEQTASNQQIDNQIQKKSIKSIFECPTLIVAIVTGVVFWIIAVISAFK